MIVGNPFLRQAEESNSNDESVVYDDSKATKKGIILKTLFCLVFGILAGAVVAVYFNKILYDDTLTDSQLSTYASRLMIYIVVVGIVSFFAAMVGRFAPSTARIMAPVYSIGEGSMIGLLCAVGEAYVPGITIEAGLGTAVLFGVVLGMYALGAFKNRKVVMNVAVAFFITMFVIMIGLFIYSIAGGSLSFNAYAIILVFFLLYGAIMLVLNFYEADDMTKHGVDKKYEWTVALGLIITIFYLFVQIFRLILLFASRNN